MTTRAKFRCVTESRSAFVVEGDVRTYEFSAQYDQTIPEDQRYAKYTPSGSMKITVDNPNVQFKLGAQYYLDITEAEENA